MRIAINGFGRIGRQITRQLLSSDTDNLTLVAINTLESIDTAIHLLKYDSNYGAYNKKIIVQNNALIIDDHKILFFNQPNPSSLPWGKYNIDIVVDCSGHFIKGEKAALHINAGATKVLITAAAINPDITLCMGVNHENYNCKKHNIISGSSCTTNCIAPVLKIIEENYGIESCLASILHSYTNSQNILDSYSTDLRRARAADNNILPTNTSAVHQVPIIIPSLKNKFDGLAIRVPTPVVHLADLVVKTNTSIDKDHLVKIFQKAAAQSLKGILSITDKPVVSCDIRGSKFSSIIDLPSMKTFDKTLKILVWHDNEYAYSNRIIDLLSYIAMQDNSFP